MPLVTVTTSKRYYPTAESPYDSVPDEEQLTMTLVAQLPKLIAGLSDKLSLDEGTSEDAVLVDIKQFHLLARNVPDISVYMAFSEILDTEESRTVARDALKDAIEQLLEEFDKDGKVGWSLDLVWGPSHGYYRFMDTGNVKSMTW